MSSFSLKNNLTIDNNKYLNWLNDASNTRHNIIGLNTNDNLIISSPNNVYITNASTFIDSLTVNNNVNINTQLVLQKNNYISTNTTNGASNGFIGISSSLTTTGTARFVLYGNDHATYPGNSHFYSGTNGSAINFYNGTTNSLTINENNINLNNNLIISNTSSTFNNIVLINNTSSSLSSTTGALIITGGLGVKGNISIDNTSNLLYNNTTPSTNYTTASLILPGGLSISNTTIASDVNNGGALSVAGGFALGQNAAIGGNVTLYNNSSTTSTSSFNANLVVYGGIGVNDAIYSRSDTNSQINISPATNNNPTTISFYKNNSFSGNSWIIGQSDSNFMIANGTNGILVISTSGNTTLLSDITTGNINFTGSLYQNGVVFSGGGGIGNTNGNITVSNLSANNISVGVSNIFGNSFNASNNVNTPSDITGFYFTNSNVASFTASVNVIIYSSNGNLYETFTLNGSRINTTNWVLSSLSIGDISGIVFSITSSGQVQYTSTNITGWTSSLINFTVTQNSVTGDYTSITPPTSGNTYVYDSITLTNTTDALSFINPGALNILGGATIQKSLYVNLISSGSIITPGVTVGTLYATSITSGNAQVSDTISAATVVTSLISSGSVGTPGATIGTLYTSIITSGNAQVSGTISAATVVATLISSGSIGTPGATIGTLYANNITSSNIYVSGSVISVNVTSINVIDTNITTGTLNVSSGITTNSLLASGIIRITSAGLSATFNSNTIGSLYTTGGNVGINTTSPAYKLDVQGLSPIVARISGANPQLVITNPTAGNESSIALSTSSDFNYIGNNVGGCGANNFGFYINGATRMLITSQGNIGIGIDASPTYIVYANGTMRTGSIYVDSANLSMANNYTYYAYNPGGGTYAGGVANVGNLATFSITAVSRIQASEFNATSDERIKTNIHNINSDDCDTILSLLQPKTYNYIDNIHESRSRYGLIAQEVKDILPGLINYKSDYIPNIMCKAEFIDKNKFRLNNQQVTLNMNNDIRIHYSKSETNTEETLYCKIINKEISVNDTIYTIDKDKLEDKIFIYGTLVDDFHVLNYDQLIPILITGYQHQKDIIRTLSSKLDDLQNQINALK